MGTLPSSTSSDVACSKADPVHALAATLALGSLD